MFLQFALTLVGLLVCAGDIVALATLLTWQERAADPGSRRQRLLTGVVPLSSVLLLLLLGLMFFLLVLWSPEGGSKLASY
ncbi:hypothetical protein FY528_16995 [Hymenobacter lutimineralis]|uniref:Uncharacterized protein n=1 Tax=Hymenobacter lutimineralis TaxID=2606448 RepID=A0A5D6UV41_9BACT|nr:hypothetical protein [Hymenobacter lutimineralis]TYZ06758.1 hypothetical protein FY528_16995 [Hymenobacter lutimineralis]